MMISIQMMMVFKELFSKIKIMNNKKLMIICLFVLCSFSSIAQNWAKKFLQQVNNQTIYLSATQQVILSNLKSSNQNLVLDSLNEEKIISSFVDEFVGELSYYGVNVVLLPQQDTLKTLKDNEYLVHIAQIELEETDVVDSIKNVYNFADDTYGEVDTIAFYKNINGLSLNIWLDFATNDKQENKIFYISDIVTDDLQGYVEKNNPSTDTVFVSYSITPINPNDAYTLAFITANKSSRYLFDFLMNRFVWIKSNGEDKHYYSITVDRDIQKLDSPEEFLEIL